MSAEDEANDEKVASAVMEMDKWDDRVLIDAFNQAMSAYPHGWKDPGEQTVDAVSEDGDTDAADAKFESLLKEATPSGYGAWEPVEKNTPIPPIAPPATEQLPDGLSDLLMSWYYAGYYTGRFRAMQELKGNRS